jgi:glycosyl transferase family 25
MTKTLPPDLPVTFTSDWAGPFDGNELIRKQLEVTGYKLFADRCARKEPLKPY